MRAADKSRLDRIRSVEQGFRLEYEVLAIPEDLSWVTAWDVSDLALTWRNHLARGARLDPQWVTCVVDPDDGSIRDLSHERALDLLRVFEIVRQNDSARRTLRRLVDAAKPV